MFNSSAYITVITLCGSVLGLFIQIQLAKQFGLGVEMDSYLYSISLPAFMAGLMSSMMTYKLIPIIVNLEKDQELQKNYIKNIINGISKISIMMGVVGTVVMLYKNMYFYNSEISYYKNTYLLIILGWILGVAQIILSCFCSILNAKKLYVNAALVNLLPYVSIIIFLWSFKTILGIVSIPIGAIVGTVTALSIVWFRLGIKIINIKINLGINLDLLHIIRSSPWIIMGTSCFSSFAIVDAYWAPSSGEGVLSILGYAQRLLISFGNLAVSGPFAVIAPHFAELVRDKDNIGYRLFFTRSILIVGGIASIVAVVMFQYAELIIEILLQRGAFGEQETILVAKTLRYMLPGMVAMLMSAIALKALFCFENTHKGIALLGVTWTLGYFLLSGELHHLGSTGFAISYSIIWIFFLIAILIFNFIKTIQR